MLGVWLWQGFQQGVYSKKQLRIARCCCCSRSCSETSCLWRGSFWKRPSNCIILDGGAVDVINACRLKATVLHYKVQGTFYLSRWHPAPTERCKTGVSRLQGCPGLPGHTSLTPIKSLLRTPYQQKFNYTPPPPLP